VRIVKNDDLMSDAMTDAPPVEVASTEIVIDKARISERNKKLEQARDELKEKFVGIDAVIDELIDAIRIWFLMPEVLSRPVIINLWGMTGVGKTDLVRRLVRAIDSRAFRRSRTVQQRLHVVSIVGVEHLGLEQHQRRQTIDCAVRRDTTIQYAQR
jgi:hypothetical protein